MTTVADLFADALTRLDQSVHAALEDVDDDRLALRIDGEANSIAWLVWHLSRILDHHISQASGVAHLWEQQGWPARFEVDWDDEVTGYGHTSADVGALRPSAQVLRGYFEVAHGRATDFVAGVLVEDLDRVVDESFEPPVTLGVRLVSIVNDTLQHAGQAAFARGIILRR